ncbi:MAG: exported hypothetical protein [Arenicellales bacterium IbO2]|nr:hypothetical protein [Gammaproteobacteria bacterium]MDA8009189.1 hypothetical protein [Alphaproteobacteria bacterium]MDA8030329.1 hypothetical protein [Alphaproteobacteria bacterium]CAJ2376794.1 MAG: exported hypothetical protein [Arenicellales bacterium IbO2]
MKAVKMLLGAVVVLAVPSVVGVAHAELVFGAETRMVRNTYPSGSASFSDSALFRDLTSPCTGVCRLFGQVRGDTFGMHVSLGRTQMGAFREAIASLQQPLYVLDLLGTATFGERVKGDVRIKGVGMLGLSLLESRTEGPACPVRCLNSACTSYTRTCRFEEGHDVNLGVKIVGGVEIPFRENWIGQVCVEYADYEPFQKRDFDQLALAFRFGYRF